MIAKMATMMLEITWTIHGVGEDDEHEIEEQVLNSDDVLMSGDEDRRGHKSSMIIHSYRTMV